MDLQHSKLHVSAIYLDIFTAPSYPQLATLLVDRNPLVGNIYLNAVFLAGVLGESHIGNLKDQNKYIPSS